jgi:hypothetical protein
LYTTLPRKQTSAGPVTAFSDSESGAPGTRRKIKNARTQKTIRARELVGSRNIEDISCAGRWLF